MFVGVFVAVLLGVMLGVLVAVLDGVTLGEMVAVPLGLIVGVSVAEVGVVVGVSIGVLAGVFVSETAVSVGVSVVETAVFVGAVVVCSLVGTIVRQSGAVCARMAWLWAAALPDSSPPAGSDAALPAERIAKLSPKTTNTMINCRS